MEDPNEEEGRIQEFHLTETNKGRLRRLWHNGCSLGKKIALTGIVVATAPLALPSLVVLSAFGVVFTVPFGFYFASYAVTDKLMSTLLSKPEPPPPPLLFGYANVSSDDDEEEAYKYNVEKVEEEGYEEDCDLEEEEMVEEENSEIRGDSGFAVGISGLLGIDENLKDMGEVIVDGFEQDGYEEDAGEYIEKEEPIPDVATEILKGIREGEEEISLMEEEKGKMRGNDIEAVVVSAEVGGENDIDVEQVEEVDVFVPRVSTEDYRPKVKFGDIEPEELERETTGMVESIRDEGSRETKNLSIRDIGDIKQVYLPSEKEIDDGLKRLRNVGSVEGKFGDVELGESENENVVRLEPLSNEDKAENANLQKSVEKISLEVAGEEISNTYSLEQLKLPSEKGTAAYPEKKEPIPTISSEILKGIREAEEEIPAMKEGRGEMLGNDIEAVVASAEVGGENDRPKLEFYDVEGEMPGNNVESVVVSADVGGENDINVEQVELERGAKGMIESIRGEGRSETKNHAHSMEKMSPFTSGERERDIGDIKHVYVPSETERLKNASGSVEGNFGDVEQLSNERKYENTNLQHSLEKTSPFLQVSGEDNNKNNPEQLKLPSEELTVVASAALQEFSEPVSTCQDTTEDEKVGIGSEKPTEGTNLTIGPKGDRGEVIAVDEDLVCVKKLVVHVKKSGDNTATSIREETELKTSGKTLICMRADTRGTSSGGGLDFLGQDNEVQDRCSQSADYHQEGIDIKSGEIQDANLHDHELPAFAGASTSMTTEGLNNEDSIWKLINAMRTVIGYEATPHASCVEELKELYVFTGVEPPASFSEPSSMADVNEKLQFLMAIVGVKM